jgi:hypothetical protein
MSVNLSTSDHRTGGTNARPVWHLAVFHTVAVDFYREHRTIVWLVAAYIAAGGLTLTVLGRPWPVAVVNPAFHTVWSCCSVAWLFWQYVRSPRLFRTAIAPDRLVGAVFVAAVIVPSQITFQALKQSIGPVLGFWADPFVHRLDVAIHGGMAWLWLKPVLASPTAIRLLDVLYLWWFIALTAFCLWVCWTRHREIRQRALIGFLLMWMGAGTVMAAVLPSVGPCFYANAVVDAPNPYAPLLDRLDAINASGTRILARGTQQVLWETRQAEEWKAFGGISAMPSLHVGIAVFFAIVAWSVSRILGAVAIAYALAIQIGAVVLGWHYAVDGYVGALCAFATWKAAGVLASADRRWNPVAPSAQMP